MAHNYDEEIHKLKKDAVMFFYAPWCGHCKEFDPIYKKVAKKMLKNNENIVFGKMDGSSNDIPYMFPPLKVNHSCENISFSFLHFRDSRLCFLFLLMKSMTQFYTKVTGLTNL